MFKRIIVHLLLGVSLFCTGLQAETAEQVVLEQVSTDAVKGEVQVVCEGFVKIIIDAMRDCLDKSCTPEGGFSFVKYSSIQAVDGVALMTKLQEYSGIHCNSATGRISSDDVQTVLTFLNFILEELADFMSNRVEYSLAFMNAESRSKALALNQMAEDFIVDTTKSFFVKLAAGENIARKTVQSYADLVLAVEPENRSVEERKATVAELIDIVIETQLEVTQQAVDACVDEQGVFDGSSYIANQGHQLIRTAEAIDAKFLAQASGDKAMYANDMSYVMRFSSLVIEKMFEFQAQQSDFALRLAHAKTEEEAVTLLNAQINVVLKARDAFIEQNFSVAVQG